VGLLGAVAAVRPARAQQLPMPVVGYLGAASAGPWATRVQAFREGLAEAGYVEGRNVAIEYRWAEGHPDRLPVLAAELVQRKVAVIVTPGNATAALAAKAATPTIPIVFETGADPVAAGLVPSLRRPGGNVTGTTAMSFELGPKRLEVLHQLVPSAKDFALLVNPASPYAEKLTSDMQAAAQALGLQLHLVRAGPERDVEVAFPQIVEARVGGLLTNPDPYLNARMDQLALLTIRHAVPTVSHIRAFVTAGGLMSYGSDISDTHRMAGAYAGRILKGEKPGDLPVQQSAKIELVINVRTAKALGLPIPASLLAAANEVIE
jgi:putative ABC transport system substrate-binding protein